MLLAVAGLRLLSQEYELQLWQASRVLAGVSYSFLAHKVCLKGLS